MKRKELIAEPVVSRPISTVVTEPAEEDQTIIERDSFYTHRLRQYLLSVPISNLSAQSHFRHIVRKIIAILRLTHVSKEIKAIGVHSVLITRGQMYRKRLHSLLTKGRLEVKNSTIDLGPKWVINPDAFWKVAWDAFISLLLLFCLLYIPYRLSFQSEEPNDASHQWLETSMDICFFLDILLTLNTWVVLGHAKIVGRKGIFLNYLRGFLIIDVASILPFGEMSGDGGNTGSNKLLRLLRLGRLVRITGSKTIKKWVSSVLKSDNSSSRQAPLVLIACVFIVLIAGHITACLWHFVAVINPNPQNWLTNYNLQDSNVNNIYFLCLYWTIEIFATIGFGDITPINNYERALCIFWLIAGTLLFSTIVGTVVSALTASDTRVQIVSEKMGEMETLALDLQLSYALKKRILSKVAKDTEAQALSSEERKEIMSMLSPDLRELVYERSYNGAFRSLKRITGLPQTVMYRLFAMVSYLHKEEGLVLYHEGDFADYVYFLNRGRLDYVVSSYCFRQILPGTLIGEIEVLEATMREFTCLAESPCELLVIRDQEFLHFLQDFPAYSQQVRALAARRKTNNAQAMQETLEVMSISRHRKLAFSEIGGRPRSELALTKENSDKGNTCEDKAESRESHREEFVALWCELEGVKKSLETVKNDYGRIVGLCTSQRSSSATEVPQSGK